MRVISLRLDGEASQLEVTALERHLAVCPRCREFAADTASLDIAPSRSTARRARATGRDRLSAPRPQEGRAPRRRRDPRRSGPRSRRSRHHGVTDSGPKHPSSALGFRDIHEQRQFVRSELIRLEPQAVFRWRRLRGSPGTASSKRSPDKAALDSDGIYRQNNVKPGLYSANNNATPTPIRRLRCGSRPAGRVARPRP